MKITSTIVAIGATTALLLTGCGKSVGTITPSGVATEDCDAEDYRNLEDDCGFTQADRDRAKRNKLKTKVPAAIKSKSPTSGTSKSPTVNITKKPSSGSTKSGGSGFKPTKPKPRK